MVLTVEIIKRTPQFQAAWLLGLNKHTKITADVIHQQNLPELCDRIIGLVPTRGESSAGKVSLYLLSVLAGGAVVIYQMQTDFLQKDMNRLMEMTKKKSFIAMFAEQFEREHEATQIKKKETKMRTMPIVSLEEFDELVDLANLEAISASLGINAVKESLLMADAIPNPPNIIHSFYDERPNISTFIDGNGSDEQRDFLQPLFDDVVTVERVSGLKRQPIVQEEQEVPVKQPAQNPIIEIEEPQQVIEDPIVQHSENPIHSLIEPPIQQIEPLSARSPTRIVQCALWSPDGRQKDQEQVIKENEDLVIVPHELNQPLRDYMGLVNNLPEHADLPPWPFDLTVPPPAKRSRIEEEEEEIEEVERHRKRNSSRPATPGNLSSLANLEMSAIVTGDKELSFELDSQIREQPVRKMSKRHKGPIFGEDLEIDVAVQKVLLADWSSLVRDKEDVMVRKNTLRTNKTLEEINDPSPFTRLGGKFARELRPLFKSMRYQELVEIAEQEQEQLDVPRTEDPLLFASICLKSPDRTLLQMEEEFVPLEMNTLPNRPPEEEATSPIPDRILFASTCLLSTPESKMQEKVIEALQLEPLLPPEFVEEVPIRTETFESTHLEAARRRMKSTLGVGMEFNEDQLETNRPLETPDKDFENVEILRAPLADIRTTLHEKLLFDAEEKSPNWLNFNEFTANFSRKKAAMAFESLLQHLKSMKMTVKQDAPFDTIFVKSTKQTE